MFGEGQKAPFHREVQTGEGLKCPACALADQGNWKPSETLILHSFRGKRIRVREKGIVSSVFLHIVRRQTKIQELGG